MDKRRMRVRATVQGRARVRCRPGVKRHRCRRVAVPWTHVLLALLGSRAARRFRRCARCARGTAARRRGRRGRQRGLRPPGPRAGRCRARLAGLDRSCERRGGPGVAHDPEGPQPSRRRRSPTGARGDRSRRPRRWKVRGDRPAGHRHPTGERRVRFVGLLGGWQRPRRPERPQPLEPTPGRDALAAPAPAPVTRPARGGRRRGTGRASAGSDRAGHRRADVVGSIAGLILPPGTSPPRVP